MPLPRVSTEEQNLDSPNNAETDDDKKKMLFDFILCNTIKNQQLIVSSVGFNKGDYPDYIIDKTIILTNEKYQLLNNEDYQKNLKLLTRIIEIE